MYLESGDVKFDSTYIYANSFTATNGFVLSGALVTEKNINITGAMAQINSSSDSTMTMYSKYGNINGGQASSEYHGLVFAPNGVYHGVVILLKYMVALLERQLVEYRQMLLFIL